MFKRWLIIIAALTAVGVAGYFGFTRYVAKASPLEAQEPVIALPVEAGQEIIAEGRLVPVQDVQVTFAASGVVRQVLVQAGDQVRAGQVLARLDTQRLETDLREAQANLALAEARLAQASQGPDAEDLVVATAAVEVCQAGVQSAEGVVASAQANLSRARRGATAEELAIAERRVEQAKNALWGAQAQRDAVCGQVGRGAREADCDGAQASVQRSEEEVRIAQLQLDQVRAGPIAEDVAVAQAQLDQALGQLASAEAQVFKAEAERARAQKGPSAEEMRIAQAGVEQARAALRRAELALAEAELRAPMSGHVIKVDLKVGQPVGPTSGLVHIADLTRWVVETTDLSELSVVSIALGDRAVVRFDALPDLSLEGTVTVIEALGEMTRGEIAYRVTITPEQVDPRLRWNMTADVSIMPTQRAE